MPLKKPSLIENSSIPSPERVRPTENALDNVEVQTQTSTLDPTKSPITPPIEKIIQYRSLDEVERLRR